MSTAAPFLNEYKRKFLKKRIIENVLSGLILKIESDDRVPRFIYFLQVFLFLLPLIVAGIGILITDVTGLSKFFIAIIAACIYFAIFALLRTVSIVLNNQSYSKMKTLDSQGIQFSSLNNTNKSTRTFNDETTYHFENKIFSLSTFNFVYPPLESFIESFDQKNKSKLIKCILRNIFDSSTAALLMFCAIYFESFVYLNSFYSIAGSICIFITNWIVYLMAFYSLCIRAPLEPAIYQLYNNNNYQHYTRAFYVLLFLIIEFIYK
jgi:hypothetical protein